VLCYALFSFNTLSALLSHRNRASKLNFGAVAKCSALHKAFPQSQRFDKSLLRFGAALWAALKHHQSAVDVNYALKGHSHRFR
jgi:hypothetical protein